MINIELLVQVVVGILIGVLTAVILDFRNEWQEQSKSRIQDDNIRRKALKEILGKFLDDMYSYYTEVGYIPLDKLHQCRRIYDCYHGLGGNGTGTAEMNRLEQLPNTKDMIE